MAEIRTYDQDAGDPIAQALRAALGEPVLPVPPGSRPARSAPKPSAPSWSWTSPPIILTEPGDDTVG